MKNYKTYLISCFCLLFTYISIQQIGSSQNVEVVEKNLDNFPYKVGDYIGSDIKMADVVVKELNADVYVYRNYVNDQGDKIALYIGYYGTKKGGRTGHNPSACYPGSGWAIISESKRQIPVSFDSIKRLITINCLHVKKDSLTQIVFHWYQANGYEVLSNGIDQNINRFKSIILHNRNDGAFVRVSSSLTNNPYDASNRMKIFSKEIYPLIAKHWPLEK